MQRRLTVALAALVLLPLAALGTLAVRISRNEQQLVRQRFEELLEARLREVDARAQHTLEARSRHLLELTRDLGDDPDELRRLVRTTPEIDQLFVQRPDGRVLHPPLGADLSKRERAFIGRIGTLLDDRVLWQSVSRDEARSQALKAQRATPADHGWYTLYRDAGLHLLLWRIDARGFMVGLELNRPHLIAALVVDLSLTEASSTARVQTGAITLVDSRGRLLWMRGDVPVDATPALVEVFASPPLGSWRWRYHHPAGPTHSTAATIAGASGFAAIAIALIGLAVYLYRESTRDLREAAQRVRFVNQVSHELRTPLTNIRLYAELLEQHLGDNDPRVTEQLGVIVAESHRLSRLIGNVLAFARQRRGQLTLHPSIGVLDDTVNRVVEQFRPTLEARGVDIFTALNAPHRFAFDSDAVEQVLANLIANVDKYAAAGRVVRIMSRQTPEWTVLEVADNGPGIALKHRESVFEPFVRLSNRLTEGASGTGMGLAISRDIARLHGGELRLLATDRGACFELRLPCQHQPAEETT